MSFEKHGSCLCGAVKLSINVEKASVDACHCSMCRKWGGGPLLSVHCAAPVTFTAGQPVIYDSSAWAERLFCGQCGTHLLYRLKSGDFDSVSVGVLEGTPIGSSICRSISTRSRATTALPTTPRP